MSLLTQMKLRAAWLRNIRRAWLYLMIKRLRELLDADKSFAFETTASGTNYVKHLKSAKANGYQINLTFLWLSKPEEAVKRVAQRVKQGGHNVPQDSVIRRYYSGIKNLMMHYLPLADEAFISSVGWPIIKQAAKVRAIETPNPVKRKTSFLSIKMPHCIDGCKNKHPNDI